MRAARPRDLPAVSEIEEASFSAPWSVSAFRTLFQRDRVRFLVAESEDGVIGHAVLWYALDEAELANLAVAPEERGRGVAGVLVDRLIEECRAVGVRRIFLEVRESNRVALRLYRGKGFQEVGVRAAYYQNPREDARVLRYDLPVER